MSQNNLMEQELSMAESALKFGNDAALFPAEANSGASITLSASSTYTLHEDKLSSHLKASQKGGKGE